MNQAVLRLLDANVNRAREALRVIEDYARFVLDDGELCAELKNLRHALTTATREFTTEAILHRDTPGDAGRENKTLAEMRRQNLAEVVIAAGKRLGEALRAIEEFLKIDSPAASAQVERIRYRFYTIEQILARTFRTDDRFNAVRLYVLITESVCRLPWLQTAELALRGGADCLQLREKSLEAAELLQRARQLVQLCRQHQALCIINDRPDIALLSGADGVHLGQHDLPAIEARKILGPRHLIGVSTHNLAQARQAQADGADYIGVGPCFVSGTKPRDFVAGLDWLDVVAKTVRIPAVAIAGITAANVDEVIQSGLRRIAVTAAVAAADDPQAAAATLKARLFSTGEFSPQRTQRNAEAEKEMLGF
jgi:thiamine-phosphate pyrophosphorylase